MSPAKPTSAPTSSLHLAAPLPSNPHRSVTSSPHSSIAIQKRAPLFSTACALSLIRNSAYLFRFVRAAHSLPKTPGSTVALSNSLASVPLTPAESISFVRITLSPIESYSFVRIAPKPNGILLFQNDPRGWGTSVSTIQVPLEQASAPVTPPLTPMDVISSKRTPSKPFRICLRHKLSPSQTGEGATRRPQKATEGSPLKFPLPPVRRQSVSSSARLFRYVDLSSSQFRYSYRARAGSVMQATAQSPKIPPAGSPAANPIPTPAALRARARSTPHPTSYCSANSPRATSAPPQIPAAQSPGTLVRLRPRKNLPRASRDRLPATPPQDSRANLSAIPRAYTSSARQNFQYPQTARYSSDSLRTPALPAQQHNQFPSLSCRAFSAFRA